MFSHDCLFKYGFSIDKKTIQSGRYAYISSWNLSSHPCKFPMRAQARNAGPPKKLFNSAAVILKSWSKQTKMRNDKSKEMHSSNNRKTEGKLKN